MVWSGLPWVRSIGRTPILAALGLLVNLGVAGLPASSGVPGAAEPLLVSVGGPAEDPAYLPVWAAAALGTFDAEGVQPTLRRAKHPTAAVAALRDGEAQVAVTTFDQAIRGAWVRGSPVRILVAHTQAPAAALLVAHAEASLVRSPGDLRGKRVGIPGPGTTGHLLLLALLRQARLEPWQLEIVSLGGATLVARLASGDLAAAVVEEPWASRALDTRAGRVLVDFRQPEVTRERLGGAFHEIVSVMRAPARGPAPPPPPPAAGGRPRRLHAGGGPRPGLAGPHAAGRGRRPAPRRPHRRSRAFRRAPRRSPRRLRAGRGGDAGRSRRDVPGAPRREPLAGHARGDARRRRRAGLRHRGAGGAGPASLTAVGSATATPARRRSRAAVRSGSPTTFV